MSRAGRDTTSDNPPPDDGSSHNGSLANRPPPLSEVRRIRLGRLDVDVLTQEQAIEVILNELDAGRGGTVVTPNLDHLDRAHKNPLFRDINGSFTLSVADGMPLIWASRIRGTPLPERVAGSDLFVKLPAAAARRGRSVFLFGGNAGMAERSAEKLVEASPTLKIAGTYYPEFGFETKEADMAAAAEALRLAKPDIVFVALGSPKQEAVISRLRETLPNAWWLGVGISFSFLAGDVKRAPPWMRGIGGEFLHRLWQEPKRLAPRYAGNALYGVRLFAQAALHRLGVMRRPEPTRPVLNGVPTQTPRPKPSARSLVYVPMHDRVDAEETPMVREVLSQLREVILLGGSTLASRMAIELNRPTIELPLRRRGEGEEHAGKMERILDAWLRWNTGLARFASLKSLPTRLVINDNLARPFKTTPDDCVPRDSRAFEIVNDRSEYRGTGGVLHDLTSDHNPDDLVLVCTARQVMLNPLDVVVRTLAGRIARGAHGAVVSHEGGEPVGVYLLRCRVLHSVNAKGLIDMKQQVLPQANKTGLHISVVHNRQPTGLPLFGVAAYVSALQQYHATRGVSRGAVRPVLEVPGAEDFSCHFQLVEAGADVHPSAVLHDAVILEGATVEADAAVIGGVIGPGEVVRRGEVVHRRPNRRRAG